MNSEPTATTFAQIPADRPIERRFTQIATERQRDFEHALNLRLTDADLLALAAKVEAVWVYGTLYEDPPRKATVDRSKLRRKIENLRHALRDLSGSADALLRVAIPAALGNAPDASQAGKQLAAGICNRIDKRLRRRIEASGGIADLIAPDLLLAAMADACDIALGLSPSAAANAAAQQRLDELAPTRKAGRPAGNRTPNKIVNALATIFAEFTGREPTATQPTTRSRPGLFWSFVEICIPVCVAAFPRTAAADAQDSATIYTRRIPAVIRLRNAKPRK